MANTTITPNMNLIVPTVGTDPGPDWANNVNADLSIIDSHNHSNTQGVQITPSGLNINADLTMGGNNLTNDRSVRFSPQSAPLSGTADLGCIYESGVDLYYNDGAGNQVRITQSGSVTGATGTISGLPSGTASASFSGTTFTFQSATNTPANMAVGPLIVGRNVSLSPTITIAPNSSIVSNYSFTLPAAVPSASNAALLSDTFGNITFQIPVYVFANGASNASSTSVPFKNTSITDTTSSYSASTGQFTAPVVGYYSVCASAYTGLSPIFGVVIYKNNSALFTGTAATATTTGQVSAVVSLLQGDTIDIRPNASVTPTGVASYNYLTIYKVG